MDLGIRFFSVYNVLFSRKRLKYMKGTMTTRPPVQCSPAQVMLSKYSLFIEFLLGVQRARIVSARSESPDWIRARLRVQRISLPRNILQRSARVLSTFWPCSLPVLLFCTTKLFESLYDFFLTYRPLRPDKGFKQTCKAFFFCSELSAAKTVEKVFSQQGVG